MLLRSRAPARIDFAGGYTDLIPFASKSAGAVLNAAINLYAYVTLQDLADDNSVNIHAIDFNRHIMIPDAGKVEYDGKFDLLKAALHHMSVPGGLDLLVHSEAPPGGGLGSSAATGIAFVGILSQYMGDRLSNYEIADVANEIERKIGVCCGKQDHYASALGGINYMEFHDKEVEVSKLELDIDIQCELESRLCLCYTGRSRFAKEMLQKVVDAYFNGDVDTVKAIASLRLIASAMKNSLLSGDLELFGKLLHRNWQNQKRLHPSISNPQIDRLFDIAYSNGSIGGKACGAGGGGCLVFFCDPGKKLLVERKLRETGAKMLNFGFDFSGLQTWASEENAHKAGEEIKTILNV